MKVLAGMDSMDIVNNALIPALDKIGEEFEKGTLFLPQLIMAAGVAQGAFEVIRKHMIMKLIFSILNLNSEICLVIM